jgi:hypothetical protein
MPADPARMVRFLRLGHPSSEFGPNAAADMIEKLANDLAQANARVRELETTCLPSVETAERNGFARGFRAAAVQAAQMEADPDTADAIARMQPSFVLSVGVA